MMFSRKQPHCHTCRYLMAGEHGLRSSIRRSILSIERWDSLSKGHKRRGGALVCPDSAPLFLPSSPGTSLTPGLAHAPVTAPSPHHTCQDHWRRHHMLPLLPPLMPLMLNASHFLPRHSRSSTCPVGAGGAVRTQTGSCHRTLCSRPSSPSTSCPSFQRNALMLSQSSRVSSREWSI